MTEILLKPAPDQMRMLENIGVTLTVEVGRSELTIRDLLRLSEGSVVELNRMAGDPLDVLVNGTLVAKGEVVMVGERFGIRFGQIITPEERADAL
jgi:flagellar motor switch protein FliN